MKNRGLGKTKTTSLLHYFTVIVVLLAGVLVCGQSQKPPVFRTRVDLMQLDVTVLDKSRKPVRGLTAADFVLLEDKTPQKIEAFTAIDVPDRVVAGPVWEKTATADVTSNEIDNQRIFVLVLDDANGLSGPDPFGRKEMKRSVEQFIDLLGPKDLVAAVFTGTSYSTNQNLTADKAKVLNAVRAYPDNDGNLRMLIVRSPAPGGPPHTEGTTKHDDRCRANKEIQRLVEAVVENLSTLPDRRKAIVYFGGDLPWADAPDSDVCGTFWRWRDIFAKAEQAHVTINPVDTVGLRPGPSGNEIADHYRAVAENTGGHPVVQSNDFVPGLKQVLVENSSYYLLAYQPTNAAQDGTFRRLAVTVRNRPDVEVITRKSYWAERTKTTDRAPEPAPPQVEAMAGVLPLSALSLRATAAPFAIPGSGRAVVALAVGVKQPAFAGRTTEQVNVLVKAFSADGDPKGSDEQTIPITVPAPRADQDVSRYDVFSRIELPKPGKYELRFSAHSDVSDTRGSVYVDVEVPDFRDARVSLSGVVLNAIPSPAAAPARLLRDLTPLPPTTEREFGTADIVTTFLRVYQGGTDNLSSLPIKTTIVDAAGKSVFNKTDTLAAEAFRTTRAADYQFRLPLATLKAGEYLLTFEAGAGKTLVRRDVRFQVR